ncbi:MAG: cell division protein FtsX [Bacteroidetes bacterium]|nr:MAG: cell division protein FtsX [Bacteroidota bacterium]REK04785.1 MAG: cell division protein FtsX [Bacteroidota bacterium]REK36258.1 MAG: cell division protein FtsX [Bacteroidota bacterium]REK51078.1 MAG: cell division protein FtsX [Bacteroidota bacterium]
MQEANLKSGTRSLRTSYASVIISISLVLFMLGLLGLMIYDARKISEYVKENFELTLYLNEGISNSELNKLNEQLGKKVYIKSLRYTSKDEALENLKLELGEGAMDMLESNPLPASFDLRINAAYANADSLAMIQKELSGIREVRETVYRQNEVEQMNRNFRTIAMIILVFSSLLFFIAIALINNTIRLSIFNKRFLIKSMQLVGATRGFIRWPFLKKGIVHGFYAGIIACLLLSVIIYLVHHKFPGLGQLSDIRMLGLILGGVLILGLLLSFFSTLMAVNRYLRLKTDELY